MNPNEPGEPSSIAQRLGDLGLDAERLAATAGVHYTSAYRWLSGEHAPQSKHLRAIAEAEGCNYTWLKEGVGEPFPDQSHNGPRNADGLPIARAGAVGGAAALREVGRTVWMEIADTEGFQMRLVIVVEASGPRRVGLSERHGER